MNATIFALTLREFIGQKRSLLILLLAAIPIGLAVIVRLSDPSDLDRGEWTANTLLDGSVITTILPLSCLLLGTAAFGTELENGTMLYLLTKPISRTEIVLAKFGAAVVLAMAFLVSATAAAGLIAISGTPESGIVVGFTVAAAVGILAYSALFILLSLVTSRALLIGLVYVFVWEAAVTELFSGVAYVSIRQYCLGIADLISSADADVFEADVPGLVAAILVTGATAGMLLFAIRKLEVIELSGPE